MKYILEIDSRANYQVTAEQKHLNLVATFMKLPLNWRLKNNSDLTFPKFYSSHVGILSLYRKLNGKLKGSIFYRYRNNLEDHHDSDDRIYIEFNSKDIEFSELIDIILPTLIVDFDAYSASIFPEDLFQLKDSIPFEVKEKFNFRNTLDFFRPYQFMDAVLINNIFNCTLEVFVSKIKNLIVESKYFNNGVLLLFSKKYLDLKSSKELNIEIQKALNVKFPIKNGNSFLS